LSYNPTVRRRKTGAFPNTSFPALSTHFS